MGLSSMYGYGGADEDRFKVLDRAWELGNTFWDTADVYFDSEDLIGKWFTRTGKRNDIFLATKCGAVMDANGNNSIRSDREYIHQACDKSLKRLGTPVELTVKAMAELKEYVNIRTDKLISAGGLSKH
ncbi:hypothetical protein PLIIFM63780_002247 [Purpureocillium lilacinum]|nr:hypothetical protein PLIIFM63780_002247 [Purpureocillium lilacinum]